MSWGAISCMSARRLAIVTDSSSPAGRSATRARISSGSVSWRRRLCARLALIPRSAHTAAIRSSSRRPARAAQQSRNCSCWSTRLSCSRWLACAWMRRISSALGSWSSSSTIRLRIGLQALVPVAAGELVAGLGGEVAALAVVDEHGPVGARAVADAGDQLAGAAQHRGEPLDPLLGDLASRVGRRARSPPGGCARSGGRSASRRS